MKAQGGLRQRINERKSESVARRRTRPGRPMDDMDDAVWTYFPPRALICCSFDSIEDGMESIGIDLSHFSASFGSFDVVSSSIPSVTKLGSSLSMPWAAATALRNANRTIQVWASRIIIFISG